MKILANYFKYLTVKKSCKFKTKNSDLNEQPSIVSYVGQKFWANDSCQSSDSCASWDPNLILQEKLPKQCRGNKKYNCIHILENQKLNARAKNKIEMKVCNGKIFEDSKTFLDFEGEDPKSSLNLQRKWKQYKCQLARLAEKIQSPIFSPSLFSSKPLASKEVNLTGLACRSNSSLTLIALDSLIYHQFAERLGIDILNKKDKTAVVILNEKLETHHVLEGNLTDETFKMFLFNFTLNKLPRASHSSSVTFKSTHVYKEYKDCNSSKDGVFCVEELNSESFLPTVLEHKVIFLLLF